MSIPLTIECQDRFQDLRPEPASTAHPGRVPRVARLMALAIRMDGLLRQGVIRDYAALARLGHVSRARISQIMNLLLLAPDIQEAILFLAPVERGRDPIPMKLLQPIALAPYWGKQRRLWQALRARSTAPTTQ